MLKFLLIVALIFSGVAVFYVYNLTLKLNSQNTRLRVLAKRNNELQSKLKLFERNDSNIEVTYSPIVSYHGKTINKTELKIGPIQTLPKLRDIDKETNVEILDCWEAFNIPWYEVKVIMPGVRKNIKGFIKEKDIKTIEVVENNIYPYKK